MINPTYGYTKSLGRLEFADALARVKAALKDEGFGVITEIDVQATLKEKLDVDYPNYWILGACNPPLAHQALTGDPAIGLLLPCNVIVLEEADGTVTVSLAKPAELFKIVQNAEVAPLAGEVDAVLQRVLTAL